MSKIYKRTCRDCGATWRDKESFLGTMLIDLLIVYYAIVLTKGSAIDIQYMKDKRRVERRRCPNCSSDNVAETRIVEQREVAEKKQVEEDWINTPASPVLIGCLVVVSAILLFAIIVSFIAK